MAKGGKTTVGKQRPYVAVGVDYLRNLGAEAIELCVTKHIKLSWRFQGVEMSISLSSTPKNASDMCNMVPQNIRRRIRAQGFALAG